MNHKLLYYSSQPIFLFSFLELEALPITEAFTTSSNVTDVCRESPTPMDQLQRVTPAVTSSSRTPDSSPDSSTTTWNHSVRPFIRTTSPSWSESTSCPVMAVNAAETTRPEYAKLSNKNDIIRLKVTQHSQFTGIPNKRIYI